MGPSAAESSPAGACCAAIPFSHGGFDPVPEKFDLRRGPVDPAVWHGEKEKAA